jgi:lipopolysaccharide transport system ATP-binding protein
MSDTVIRVAGLGKNYEIGTHRRAYATLRDQIAGLFRVPFQTSPPRETIWALRDVSFEVNQSEVVGIIGRNGAGKSTLLKLLSRITEPTVGEIALRGRVGSLLEVGTGFHAELSGRENIFLNGAVLGMRRNEILKKFDEIVAFAEVEKFIDTPVKHYSSGMYMRLAFAVAAHLEPEILIVDEVLAVGDAAFQRKCLGKMSEVAGQGRTVLFVSHNMTAIQELCSRVLLVKDGLISEDGAPTQIVNKYFASMDRQVLASKELLDADLRRNSLSSSLFIWTKITMFDSTGSPNSILKVGEPFSLVLEGLARSEISFLRAGFSIASASGTPIFNAMQLDYGLPANVAAGVVRFKIMLDPNILAPGLYSIGLGANGDNIVDWLPEVLQFQIDEIISGSETTWQTYSGGLIRYPCKWSAEAV